MHLIYRLHSYDAWNPVSERMQRQAIRAHDSGGDWQRPQYLPPLLHPLHEQASSSSLARPTQWRVSETTPNILQFHDPGDQAGPLPVLGHLQRACPTLARAMTCFSFLSSFSFC